MMLLVPAGAQISPSVLVMGNMLPASTRYVSMSACLMSPGVEEHVQLAQVGAVTRQSVLAAVALAVRCPVLSHDLER